MGSVFVRQKLTGHTGSLAMEIAENNGFPIAMFI
jgi:hypothetical protein